MSETASLDIPDTLKAMTANIVAAYVRHNRTDDVTAVIHSVYATLQSLGRPEERPPALVPAVPVKRSVFPDYIVCLEDGKKLKTLKRHLAARYNMTPDAYRKRWGLPDSYPIVAPNYAAHRSKLAQSLGLGRRIPVMHETVPAVEPPASEPLVKKIPERRRGRPGKAT